jgi:DNA-binding IclR family transcriptional regulator
MARRDSKASKDKSGGTSATNIVPLPGTKKSPTGRKGIQSIEIGFRILDFIVKAGKPVPLRDIAAGTGMPASNVHFYLVSLTQIGVVRQYPGAKFYGLGPYALRLGIAGLEQFDLFGACKEALLDLAMEVGHTAFLGVWGNHGPTIVYRVDGPQSRTVFELRVGSVLPVLRSALGRNLLAHLPDGLTKSFVDQELSDIASTNFSRDDIDLPRNRREIGTLVEEIRKQGLSRCRGGLLTDYTAISAPIFDYSGTMVAAITLMGPRGVLDDDFAGPVAAALRKVSARISAEAGLSHVDGSPRP